MPQAVGFSSLCYFGSLCNRTEDLALGTLFQGVVSRVSSTSARLPSVTTVSEDPETTPHVSDCRPVNPESLKPGFAQNPYTLPLSPSLSPTRRRLTLLTTPTYQVFILSPL